MNDNEKIVDRDDDLLNDAASLEADEEVRLDGLVYELWPDKAIVADACDFKKKKYAIPSQAEGRPVATIGYSASVDCSSLVAIEMSDTLTAIEERAFWDCRSPTSIELPNSLTTVGCGAVPITRLR